MKFTQVASDAFTKIQLNAGIVVDYFNPATMIYGNILFATSGGVSFNANPEYADYGEDIDNVPPNTKELKKLVSYNPVMSGTAKTVDAGTIASLIGAADIDGIKIIPRNVLLASDFKDYWWIGDYSDVNTGASAGFMALHIMDGFSTTGLQIQSNDDGKGDFAFEYTGHYTIEDISIVPFEVYLYTGEDDENEIILSTYKMIASLDDNYTIIFHNYSDFTNIDVTADNTDIVQDLDYSAGEITFATPTSGSGSATIFVMAKIGTKEYGAKVKVELYS